MSKKLKNRECTFCGQIDVETRTSPFYNTDHYCIDCLLEFFKKLYLLEISIGKLLDEKSTKFWLNKSGNPKKKITIDLF